LTKILENFKPFLRKRGRGQKKTNRELKKMGGVKRGQKDLGIGNWKIRNFGKKKEFGQR